MIGTGLPRGTQRRALGKLLELRDRQPRPSLPALALVVAAVVTVSVAAALAVSLAMPTVYGAQADLLALYQPHHQQRFQVRPGITGLWQVRGRSRLTTNEALELDVEYVRCRSLILDLRILVMTVPAVLWGWQRTMTSTASSRRC